MPDGIQPARSRSARACLLAAVVAAAVGISACGSGSNTPHIASLTTSSSTGSGNGSGQATTTRHAGTATGSGSSHAKSLKGNPTALVDEWAMCMHRHGDPNQADPTIDAYGVINVTIPGDGASAQELSGAVHAGTDPCNRYIAAAQDALRAANPVAPPPDQAALVKYTDCMRANGVPHYPYPSAHMTFQGTGVDPSSPQVQNVNKLCGAKLHLPGWWVAGNGPPGDVSVSNVGPGGSPPGNPPPCFYQTSGCPKPARGGNLPAGNGGLGANSGSGAGG
jgi:hypothetical protein